MLGLTQATPDADRDGLALRSAGRRVPLIRHRFRRSPQDVPHDRVNLRRGLACGAFLAADLRLAGDGGFVCLAEADLAEETDGEGPVAALAGERLSQLRLRGADGRPGPCRVLLLEELIAMVSGSDTAPGARVLLTVRDPAAAMDRLAIRGLARLVAPVADRLVLSGQDPAAVVALATEIPGLACGWDPSALLWQAWPAGAPRARVLVDRIVAQAGPEWRIALTGTFVAAADRLGVDPIGRLRDAGLRVDCTGLHAAGDDAVDRLSLCLARGCDGIVTAAPIALERLARQAGLED